MTGTNTIDMISGHRREGKIYDLIKVIMAKKLGEETKYNLVGERNYASLLSSDSPSPIFIDASLRGTASS